ncbi:protein of unknown function [Shewanella benthica]|uniref:Uncharacterized protein n=1 Tax=Shewanella benthica TaxID=43661 RepID=A0A330M8F1_9GAMM|nr:protein of unknown function [Shewanella benthica]
MCDDEHGICLDRETLHESSLYGHLSYRPSHAWSFRFKVKVKVKVKVKAQDRNQDNYTNIQDRLNLCRHHPNVLI